MSEYRPQPPGYILFIGTAKAFDLVLHDANSSLLSTALLYSIIAVIFLYLLTREMFSRIVGVVTALLFAFVPFFWFYGAVALSYTGGACCAIVIAFFVHRIIIREDKPRWIYASVIALALSGGIREDLIMYMSPLVFYGILRSRQSLKVIGRAIVLFIVFFALWFVPMIALSGGYAAYSVATSDQFRYHATEYSVLFGNTPLQHFKMVKDMLLALGGASVLMVFYIVLYLAKRHETSASILWHYKLHFLSLWFFPAFLFFAFVFIQQPGYLLTILPAVFIAGGVALVRVSRVMLAPHLHKKLVVVQTSLILILYAIIFISPIPKSFVVAAGKPLEEKTTREIILSAIYKSVFRHSQEVIKRSDRLTSIYTEGIRGLQCSPLHTVILAFHRSSWNFSLALYYLPQYTVYYIQDYKRVIDKVRWGQNHEFIEYVKGSEIALPEADCIIALTNRQSPTYKSLTKQMGVQRVVLRDGYDLFILKPLTTSTIQIRNINFRLTRHQ